MPQTGAPSSTSTGELFNAETYGPGARKVLAGRVYSPKGTPVAGAEVEVTNSAGAKFQVFFTDKDGDFLAGFHLLDPEAARHFVATLKVTKKGFQVAHRIAEMSGPVNNLSIAISLHLAEPEDPALLSRAELITEVAPRLRQLGPADGLLAKQEKDYARGVQDFLDRHRLEDAVPRLAKVATLDPNCLKCRTMLALAEMSWGDWDDPKLELIGAVNLSIKDPKLGSAEPLLVYGVLQSWAHDPERAIPLFHAALKYSPNDALALQELGRAELQSMDWWAANETLQKAVAAGAKPDARLLHAEALIYLGNAAEAMAELNAYLNGRSIGSMPPRVRSIYDRIQTGKKDEAVVASAKAKAQKRGEETLDYLHHPPVKLPGLEPASDQQPLAGILDAVGKNVAQFFNDLPKICSMEKVHQERLTRDGKMDQSQEYIYRYLLTVSDRQSGPDVDEYRADPKGKLTDLTGLESHYMLTLGFVSAPLVFHPTYQDGSSFLLLGTQKLNGRKDYVIVYAQVPSKSRLSGTFQYGGIQRLTYTQGIAWVDAANYQITHIISDLLEPLPELRLDRETTDITFSEVSFKNAPHSFWLPQAVSVTLDWNKRVLRNNHAYSDFLVSDVESTQKIARPKDADKPLVEANAPAGSGDSLSHPP
jgi:tetratricopeptide (TPR) repeat protein